MSLKDLAAEGVSPQETSDTESLPEQMDQHEFSSNEEFTPKKKTCPLCNGNGYFKFRHRVAYKSKNLYTL